MTSPYRDLADSIPEKPKAWLEWLAILLWSAAFFCFGGAVGNVWPSRSAPRPVAITHEPAPAACIDTVFFVPEGTKRVQCEHPEQGLKFNGGWAVCLCGRYR